MKVYLKNNNENFKNVCINFATFKIKIRRIFDVFDEKQTAKKAVQYLIQKTSTTKYATTFQKKVNLIKWNDATFIIMFRKNLKKNVKNELMKTKIETKNLSNFIIECIRLNDILYNKIIKKRFENSREKFDIYAKKNSK